MDCCGKIVKYFLFGLNLLFWLAGVAILVVGIRLKVDSDVSNIYAVAGTPIIYAGAESFIVVGCVMFIIGFCGCCGAMKESKFLLGVYFIFVLLIFLTQVSLAIWGFASRASLEKAIEAGLNKTIPINPADTNTVAAVKNIQTWLKCCGLTGGCSDWFNSTAIGCTCEAPGKYDCTLASLHSCTNAEIPGSPIYSKNCYDKIVDLIESNNTAKVAAVAIGIALLEILLMVCTVVVYKSAARQGYKAA